MGKNNRRRGKLAKLKTAGTAETLGAMVDDHGNIITKHEDMADLLQNHWSRVFSHKKTPTHSTKLWLDSAYPSGPPFQDEAQCWKPSRKEVQRAIRPANCSSPGPAGIP